MRPTVVSSDEETVREGKEKARKGKGKKKDKTGKKSKRTKSEERTPSDDVSVDVDARGDKGAPGDAPLFGHWDVDNADDIHDESTDGFRSMDKQKNVPGSGVPSAISRVRKDSDPLLPGAVPRRRSSTTKVRGSSMNEADQTAITIQSVNGDVVGKETFARSSSSYGAILPAVSESPTLKSFRLFKRRWIMLFVFSLLSFSNALMWITFSPIQTIVMEYYSATALEINWLSLVYMVAYIPFVFVSSLLFDKKGLQYGILIGGALNCAGGWVRYIGAVKQSLFPLLMLGQTLAALAQTFILGVPSELAATWFGEKETATATGIAVMANQLGTAIGFILGPALVKTSNDYPMYMLYQAIFVSVLLLLTILVFRKRPPTPPSQSAASRLEGKKEEPTLRSYLMEFKKLFWDRDFMLLLTGYGVNVGCFYAISTLLTDIITPQFPGHDDDVGWIGFVNVIAGMAGSVLCSFYLDRTKRYRLVTIVVYCGSLVSVVGFAVCVMNWTLMSVYVMSGVFGFFMTGLIPVGFEFAAELSYPVAETVSSGMLNMSAQIFGVVLTLSMGKLQKVSVGKIGMDLASWSMTGFLIVGFVFICFVREIKRRAMAERNGGAPVGANKISPSMDSLPTLSPRQSDGSGVTVPLTSPGKDRPAPKSAWS